jgi:peptidoglycan/LPS O-acetylase OafA/YrhL
VANYPRIETVASETKQSELSAHIDVLDGLRGLAIGLVVLFHVWQQSWWSLNHLWDGTEFLQRYGYLGVEIFFFLSAFCLTYPFARHQMEDAEAPRWSQFWLRRALKILPSYWLAIFLIVKFLPIDISPERLNFNLWTHLLFIHNCFYETHYSITGVFWSLGVEVQFYLLFPVIIALFRRSRLLGYVVLVAIAAAYRYWGFIQDTSDSMIYTIRLSQTPAFLDLFAAGIAAAYALCKLRQQSDSPKRRILCSIVALLALAGLLLLMRSVGSMSELKSGDAQWQALYRLPFSWLLFFLTVSGALALRPVRWVLANPLTNFLALISYNLYLWHQCLGWQLRKMQLLHSSSNEPWVGDYVWQLRFTLTTLCVGITVATLLTFVVEQPILTLGRRWLRK